MSWHICWWTCSSTTPRKFRLNSVLRSGPLSTQSTHRRLSLIKDWRKFACPKFPLWTPSIHRAELQPRPVGTSDHQNVISHSSWWAREPRHDSPKSISWLTSLRSALVQRMISYWPLPTCWWVGLYSSSSLLKEATGFKSFSFSLQKTFPIRENPSRFSHCCSGSRDHRQTNSRKVLIAFLQKGQRVQKKKKKDSANRFWRIFLRFENISLRLIFQLWRRNWSVALRQILWKFSNWRLRNSL